MKMNGGEPIGDSTKSCIKSSDIGKEPHASDCEVNKSSIDHQLRCIGEPSFQKSVDPFPANSQCTHQVK